MDATTEDEFNRARNIHAALTNLIAQLGGEEIDPHLFQTAVHRLPYYEGRMAFYSRMKEKGNSKCGHMEVFCFSGVCLVCS